MALAAGKLRHRVELQDRVTTQNPNTGEMETAWQTVARVWAEITPLSAREFIAAGAEQSEVRARFTIRRRDVSASMRILHRGLAYDILGVLPDPESGLEYITLPVSEGVRVA